MSEQKFLYQLKNVNFVYQLGSYQIEAVKNVSMQIPFGKLVTLTGPSGSGKSSLLNLLGLIEPVQEGTILFQGQDLKEMKQNKQNHIRKYEIGFIFQQFHLIPVLTVKENIAFFLARQKLFPQEIEERIEQSLHAVKLWDHRNKKPNELSGGQRQRVAIARALAKKPIVFIADEPTASLDQQTGSEIMQLFVELVTKNHVSVILTTHDPMVQSFAQQSFHLVDGSLN